ncbi:MAG: ATP-dependent endonuclease, partial [Methylobacter sp.]|nr:ATP-dependent endonuclease [Methylobacter sp.]
GRVKYAFDQLKKYEPHIEFPHNFTIPTKDERELLIQEHYIDELLEYRGHIEEFEKKGIFFSWPMDLDFAMLKRFPLSYESDKADLILPEASKINAVLGDSHYGVDQYTDEEKKLFITYHKRFKLKSKPAAHINALSKLSDKKLLEQMPLSLNRLADAVIAKLAELPE